MSLEQTIQENTAAIRDLISVIKAGANPHAEDDAYRRGMQATRDAAAKAPPAPTVKEAAESVPPAQRADQRVAPPFGEERAAVDESRAVREDDVHGR